MCCGSSTGSARFRPRRPSPSALTTRQLVEVCARFRPGDLADPGEATRHALRSLARRWTVLHAEIAELDSHIRGLVMAVAPALLQRPGVGVQVAAALLVTVGENPDRLRSEAAFAHLCGVAPLPASAGRTLRHRLNHGGDRRANNALYTTVVLTRMRIDERTRAYVTRRTSEGLSKREIIRCLKHHVARELHREITAPNDTRSPAG